MVRRIKPTGFIAAMVIFLLLVIIFYQKTKLPECAPKVHNGGLNPKPKVHSDRLTPKPLHDAILRQRSLIEQDTKNYVFLPGTKLINYAPSRGGNPIRSIIFTTWRSGSTFLGDVLNAVPATFYHYEPLLQYGMVQVRGPPNAESAIEGLKMLLNCDYSKMEDYLKFGKTHIHLFTHNERLWKQCDSNKFCWNSTVLTDFCSEFPFQTMKTVRLRLKFAEEFLKHELFNVKILFLVRDPRGTIESRKHKKWCRGAPDCENSIILCADMVSDYKAAVELQNKYSNRFRVIRYEDLSLDPYEVVRSIFSFLQLDFNASIKTFLDSHTKSNRGGTFRNSKSVPFKWRTKLDISEVNHIQENCDEAMNLWGYMKFNGDGNLLDFNPLTSYDIK